MEKDKRTDGLGAPLLENAEVFEAPADTTLTAAPAPASSMCEGQRSSQLENYSTGIVQHGAIEELLQSREGLMIRERLFVPRMQHASRALSCC